MKEMFFSEYSDTCKNYFQLLFSHIYACKRHLIYLCCPTPQTLITVKAVLKKGHYNGSEQQVANKQHCTIITTSWSDNM